jgi:hypothetical protein
LTGAASNGKMTGGGRTWAGSSDRWRAGGRRGMAWHGMKAVFLRKRGLTRRQKAQLGFVRKTTPWHATLSVTRRGIDGRVLADCLAADASRITEKRPTSPPSFGTLRMRGKTRQAGRARTANARRRTSRRHSALVCNRCRAARANGKESPAPRKLFGRLDRKGRIVAGAARFRQTLIRRELCGGDVFPGKDNQKNLQDGLETAVNAPVLPAGLGCARRREYASACIGTPL